jgi:hydroxymethylpyrimidine pyrophosphatase-like HAD family hydrolase
MIAQIVSLLRQNPHVPVEVFTKGKAYIDAGVFEELKANGPAASYMSRSYIMRTRMPIEGILDFMESNSGHIENINLHFADNGEKERMRSELKQIEGVTLTSSMAHNLEIGGATTSKASGLAALSELTGIGLCEIMACGDSPNDMAMLSAVGFGVAVSNGEAEVLELADFVAPSNEDEGVAYAVERFVLGVNRPRWQLRILQIKNRALSGGRRMVRKLLKKSGRK